MKTFDAQCPSCRTIDKSKEPKPFRYCQECKNPFVCYADAITMKNKPKLITAYVVLAMDEDNLLYTPDTHRRKKHWKLGSNRSRKQHPILVEKDGKWVTKIFPAGITALVNKDDAILYVKSLRYAGRKQVVVPCTIEPKHIKRKYTGWVGYPYSKAECIATDKCTIGNQAFAILYDPMCHTYMICEMTLTEENGKLTPDNPLFRHPANKDSQI